MNIKSHWPLILTAFVIGFLTVLPNISSILKVGDKFAGIYPMFSGDEEYYLGITKEVYEGNINSGNAFIKEHKKIQHPIKQIHQPK